MNEAFPAGPTPAEIKEADEMRKHEQAEQDEAERKESTNEDTISPDGEIVLEDGNVPESDE